MFKKQEVTLNAKEIRKHLKEDFDSTYFTFEHIFDMYINQCRNEEELERLKENIQDAMESSFSERNYFIFVKE